MNTDKEKLPVKWQQEKEKLQTLVDDQAIELREKKRALEIEAALEQIRARSMAMHRSDDLTDTAVVLFQELEKLGITPRRCGFAIKQPEEPVWHFWHTTKEGQAIEKAGRLSEGKVPFFEDVFAAWKVGKVASYTRTFSGDELDQVIHFLIEQTDVNLPDAKIEVQQGLYPSQVCFNFFFFKHGALLAHTLQPLKEENQQILKRFATVFEQAYTRFIDLQKAEEQSRMIREERDRLEIALKELEATKDQLVQQEKLASLGQLTAGIAHEVKNPLNFVTNFSDVSIELIEEAQEELSALSSQLSARDGVEKVSEALKILNDIEMNLKKIHEHGSRADSIVKSMLQHSRGGEGKSEPTDLNALIKEYANLAFHGMRASKNPINVDIELKLDEDLDEIPLIAEDFSRVILNLCNNAFDAMRSLGAERSEKGENYEPKLTIRTHKQTNKVTIEIEDNGPGIPPEIKNKVLQPFFTTKKGTEGTGLGLSITNDIIKAHGGALEIHSNKERTIMAVTLNQS